MDKNIKITCSTGFLLPLHRLIEFQDDLKDLHDEDYEKLKNSILKKGFFHPISVWLNDGDYYILDGHQRRRVLLKLINEGYEVPDLPVIPIEAETIQDAKEKVLYISSQYGRMTNQGLYEFSTNAGIKLEDLAPFRFADMKMDRFMEEFTDQVTKTVEFEANLGAKELDADSFSEFHHKCPKCNFEFNDAE